MRLKVGCHHCAAGALQNVRAEHRCNRPRGIGCSEVLGTLQRLRKSDLRGDFGYAGDGGDGTLIAHLSDGSSITWESERAEIVPQPVGLSISSESCNLEKRAI